MAESKTYIVNDQATETDTLDVMDDIEAVVEMLKK